MAFLTRKQIDKMGFAHVGEHVYISEKASFHNPSKISMGSHVRIDDFCVLSAGNGGIELGDVVHIGCFGSLIGEEKIKLGNFCGLSPKASIYSSNADFSGGFLPGVKIGIPEEYQKAINKPVVFEDYAVLGTMSVVMPGVTIGEGACVGALCFVRKNLNPWYIYGGNPLVRLSKRSKHFLQYVEKIKKNETE